MQVYSCNIIRWQKKQSFPPFLVPPPDVATWGSYSPDSLATNLPSLTLFVMLQLGLRLCQYLPHCFTRWLPGRFYLGGGRRDFSVFLIPFSIGPSVAICPSLHVLLATLESASGTPQKYSGADGVPTMSEAPPLCVWILIILSLFCFPRLRMVVLSCIYHLWLPLVFPLDFLWLLSLLLNNFSVYNVLNWLSILLTGLWKTYHYDQIDLYLYRCIPFLFILNLIVFFFLSMIVSI